jgi:hypothetical protein
MLPNRTESESIAGQSRLEVTGYDDKDRSYIVKSPTGGTVRISDTFADT